MRIVIDYTPALHQSAGIGRHTRGLVQALEPLVRQEEVTLLVFGAPEERPTLAPPASMPVRITPISNRWLTIAWHRLHAPLPVEWLSGPCDLFHASDFVLPPVRRARTLLTVHDLSFLTTPQCADEGLRRYLSRVAPRSIARADHVLADSESTRRDLETLLGAPRERITVIYPGVEARFQPTYTSRALARVRKLYKLGSQPFVLGVGTLEPRKNWPTLIRAWTRLRQTTSHPHRLVLAGGKGWLADGIFDAAADSPYRSDIVFTGFVDDTDLPTLYQAADVFAFPSFYEGFGIPVLEALACGTPVVCADNSSLPEAAGDAALLVPATDEAALALALQRLIEDDALRSDLRARGLAHAARFTWAQAAQTLWQTYQQAAHG